MYLQNYEKSSKWPEIVGENFNGHLNSMHNSRPVCKISLTPYFLSSFVSFSMMYHCNLFREYAELQAKVLEERRKWQEEQEKREKQGS